MTVPPPEEPVQPARRGRLQNRLVREVTGYVFLVDLDPRVSPEVLDALELQGIAAYVEPLAGSTGAWMEVRIPARPTDRLQVDSRRVEEARALLRGHHLGLEEPGEPRPAEEGGAAAAPPAEDRPAAEISSGGDRGAAPGSAVDEEAAWAAIVAQFGSGPDAPVPPWPVSEDVDPTEARSKRADEDESARRLRRRTDVPEDEDDEDDEADDRVGAAEDEAHYEPPPPPPLPRFSRRTLGCLAAILVGLVLLLFPAALGLARTDGVAGLGVLAVVGGLGALVWGMRDGLPVDEGPDDGAVV